MTTTQVARGPDQRSATARLVVIDDSSEYRALLSLVLGRDARFQIVAEAADGAEGLAAVVDHAPDLVRTDLQMPKVDGIEFTRALRRTNGDLPIVMVTGLPGDEIVEQAYRAGVTAFLSKTGSPTRLVDTLHAVIDGRHCPDGAVG
ncbi:MAG: response regulator transcription factor [Egicoccus sp.]